MSGESVLFNTLLRAWFVFAAVMFAALLRFPAPYGRHATTGWGATINARSAWLLMESPAAALFFMWFVAGARSASIVSVVFLAMWEAHYVHRAFVYPFTLGASARRMPVLVVVFGMAFNVVNTYLNGRYLFEFAPEYPTAWLTDPRFIFGLVLFCAGYLLNRYSDMSLRRERLKTGLRYCRMDHGIFRHVCCPNYLGEMLIWVGWASATWSLAGFSFAVWTAANLLPRARAHLRWCRTHFEDYPSTRRAIIPGVW